MSYPAPILKRAEKHARKIMPRILVLFKSHNTILKLQEHIQSDNHCFFEVWVGNLGVKKVSSHKSTELFLETSMGERWKILDKFLFENRLTLVTLMSSLKSPKSLEWNIYYESWNCVDHILELLIHRFVQIVNKRHEPGTKACYRSLGHF